MLHSLLDAVREGLAAHREYERLISIGIRHDLALRAAVSEAIVGKRPLAERRSNLLFSFWWSPSVRGLTAGENKNLGSTSACFAISTLPAQNIQRLE
jgi:hypothetical protein